MEIAVVGTGYVGLVAGVCFADVGHKVICVDNNEAKIQALLDGQIPIYEPGLEDILMSAKKRLTFTTEMKEGTDQADVIFIAVGTPETEDGSADLGPTFSVLQEVCELAQNKKIIVLKSTVPVGTNKKVKEFIKENSQFDHEVVNNPEFLKEGAAIDDFLRPDRVVIGCANEETQKVMGKIYAPFVRNGHPILYMSNTAAELTKYAANSFLSVKISFANELAALADAVGADIDEVRSGFTSDNRINPSFFYPGSGYGGSCFPKDVQALIHTAEANGTTMDIVKAADQVNDKQKTILVNKIMQKYNGDVKNKTFALWGLSFKPRTDDVREAPAGYVIKQLSEAGAKIVAYDPIAMETAKTHFQGEFTLAESANEACANADALLIITEWNEFRNPDYQAVADQLKSKVIFDGRNALNPKDVKKHGFEYYCVGRQSLFEEWSMKILVAGGAGFIGSHLVDRLLSEGHQVDILDNFVTGREDNIAHLKDNSDVEVIKADIINGVPDKQYDRIYNMASPASPVDFAKIPLEILMTGSMGHKNLLDIAKKYGARILFASTSEVYGDPLENPQKESYFGNVNCRGSRACYDEAKRFGEALTENYQRSQNTDTRTVRIFNTYGPRMAPNDGRVIPNFFMQALQGNKLSVYGDGKQTRSLCYVSDLVDGIVKLMESPITEPVNIGNTNEMTILKIGEIINGMTGNSAGFEFEELPENDPKVRRPDTTRAKELLDWEPKVTAEEGLKITMEYFKTFQ